MTKDPNCRRACLNWCVLQEYEQDVVEATAVYEVSGCGQELLPLPELWGSPPRHAVLDSNKVLVFDFGSEVYVYNGRSARMELRRAGSRLAGELWAAGWDYSDCAINPALGSRRQLVVEQRPAWTVLGRINSCMETVLFREKFIDWPDKTRVIGRKAGEEGKEEVLDVNVAPAWSWGELAGVSGDELATRDPGEPSLELENQQLGRGRSYYDQAERRQYEISTVGVAAWHVRESETVELPADWPGQFHTGDTYVVRWRYKVALTGRRLAKLGGGTSSHGTVGRERCAYFFWQGRASPLSLQGASALHTVELDSERGPQLRVQEGAEQAAFLQLWQGRMAVHRGRRGERAQAGWRLFLVRAEDPVEARAVEVECGVESLRSRGVFLLVGAGRLLLWPGPLSSPQHREAGQSVAAWWAATPPPELGGGARTLEQLQPGKEGAEWWAGLGGGSAQWAELSRGDSALRYTLGTPRLFSLTSVLGAFEAAELRGEAGLPGQLCNLLHSQDQLIEAEQPGEQE